MEQCVRSEPLSGAGAVISLLNRKKEILTNIAGEPLVHVVYAAEFSGFFYQTP